MIPAKLHLRGFCGHSDTLLTLPSRGIVLVRGENGHGKSAILEALSWCLWGKTLRGTSPWTEGVEPCSARVELADGSAVQRVRQKGRTHLEWYRGDGTIVGPFETVTKAQAQLELEYGSHEEWVRAAVFTGRGASSFTGATDTERKRFLEGLLGLQRFEGAHGRAREALAGARGARIAGQVAEDRAQGALVSAQARRDELDLNQPSPQDVSLATEGLALAEQLSASLVKRLATCREALAACTELLHGLATERDEARRQREATASLLSAMTCEVCPACGMARTYGDLERSQAQGLLARQTQKHDALLASETEARVDRERLSQSMADLLAAITSATEKERAAAKQVQQLTAATNLRTALVEQAEQRLFDAETACDTARSMVTSATNAERELEAVVSALSVRGVRAHLLGTLLSAIQEQVQRWLTHLGGGLRVRLEVTEGTELAIHVEGAGGGHGYRACSTGQQRRIDVALLLALGSVAEGIRGLTPLWCDELFDALDEDGVAGVASALDEEAQRRCVVVVTHHEGLAALLRPRAAVQWTVANGVVRES